MATEACDTGSLVNPRPPLQCSHSVERSTVAGRYGSGSPCRNWYQGPFWSLEAGDRCSLRWRHACWLSGLLAPRGAWRVTVTRCGSGGNPMRLWAGDANTAVGAFLVPRRATCEHRAGQIGVSASGRWLETARTRAGQCRCWSCFSMLCESALGALRSS
jgi:hypothetical protein